MNEPTTFRAGDTVTWTEDASAYPPSDGWTMKCTISGAQTIATTAAVSGSSFVITLSAAQTAVLAAGTFTLGIIVERGVGVGLERVTLASSSVAVSRNLSTPFSGDARTHLQRVFDSICAVIEKRATHADDQLTINGRSLSRTPHAELLRLYTQYKYLVEDEQRREKIAKGLPAGNLILEHFR